MKAFTRLPPAQQQTLLEEVAGYPDLAPEQATVIALSIPAPAENSDAA